MTNNVLTDGSLLVLKQNCTTCYIMKIYEHINTYYL